MRLHFLLFLLITASLKSQEIPPILHFSPENYKAENQNWAITQNTDKFIFVANNEGLLEYNGGEWVLYPSPNNTVIRSLLSDEDIIYSGAYMEFGFWQRTKNGNLEYTSLSTNIKDSFVEDENIWNIKKLDKWILFQSSHRIYFYNLITKEVNYKSDYNNYSRIFEIENTIYVFKNDGHLVSLKNDKEIIVAKFLKELNVKLILNLFKTETGLVALTRNKGFFKIEETKASPWELPSGKEFSTYQFFCGIKLKDGSFMLGTVSNGIIHLSSTGEIINKINQTTGLSNNTVLSLFEDVDGNVWSALDNGINCINAQSYVKEFNDNDGYFGTTYCSITYNNKIYIGTNQGLFYKNLYSNDALQKVANIKGQVWALYKTEAGLLCGHTTGTFLVNTNNTAKQLSDFSGTWGFKQLPNQPNLLLVGHYIGMSVLENVNGSWRFKNKIDGFNNSARFFEVVTNNTVFVNHEYKGVFKLKLNESFTRFNKNKLLASIEKGKGSGLTKFDSILLYSSKEGVFTINNLDTIITKDPLYSSLFTTEEYISGKLISDTNNRLWSFNKSTISYLEKGPVKNNVSIKRIPIKNYLRKTTVSFENITNLYKDMYLVGKTNGYLLLDLVKKQEPSHNVYINSVHLKDNDTLKIALNEFRTFDNNQNSLTFSFSSPVFNKYQFINYQYKINDNSWVNLENIPHLTLDNLPHGTYTLSVKATIGNQQSNNIASYAFAISPPFYVSNIALFFYVLLVLLVAFIINSLSRKYYRKQHSKFIENNVRQLELQNSKTAQEVIRLKNDKLSQEVESKNRELAISTMSIVKRNEFLRSIKKELKRIPEIEEGNDVFKLIDKNLNSTKDWDFFKEAFNNADKDFLKRAKKLHPSLTHNNLKFCAYLRLNLSSKEIAPLLNISVKSVEIRRYRLRKKLNLSHNVNLTDYILSI